MTQNNNGCTESDDTATHTKKSIDDSVNTTIKLDHNQYFNSLARKGGC